VPKRKETTQENPSFEVIETQSTPTSLGVHTLIDYMGDAKQILERTRPDIIWAQSFWGAIVSHECRIPSIATIHDSALPFEGWFLDTPITRYRFVSEFQRTLWAKSKQHQSASFVQHHGLVDSEYGAFNDTRAYHLFVGGFSWGYRMKGLDLFILSAISNPQEEFVIYGTGNKEIESYLLKLSTQLKNLHFFGALSRGTTHQRAFSRAKSTFMMTRLPEAFGRVIIESLACGTPVWGSNSGAVPEILRVPQDGAIFEVGDIPPAIDFEKHFDYKEIASAARRFSVHYEVEALLRQSRELLAR